MSDEQQPEQQAQAWPFAPAYESRYSSLPASQLREAMKRLAERRRNPIPAEALAQENPEVAATLEAVEKAYLAKKQRAKQASAAKRAAQKAAAAPVEAEPVQAVVEDLTASVAELSLVPAEVAAVEPEEEEDEDEPEPEPVKPVPSKPIAIPARVPLARTATEQPAPAPKKSGLRGRFA